jgi:zinc protease
MLTARTLAVLPTLSLVLAACRTTDSGSALDLSADGAPAQGEESIAAQVDIPYTKFVLPNGLTLVVHEDHKAPIVAINVWYHVGSKNEKPAKTGFAHLFEHLMFQGTENLDGEFFEPLEKVGATGMNGTTNNDRTNYFETVPKNALDLALWLESDRMGHLLGSVDQAKLDEQRGVVQNEKRQGDNQPYGMTEYAIAAGTVPAGHPYSWSVIGSMDDLNAASLEDVKEWFRSSYGAANAVLVVCGDVDTNEVKSKVELYFGDIPAGPPIERPKAWVAPIVGTRRHVMQDRVAQPRLYYTWNIAPWGDPSLERLSLFSDVLAGGKASRLYQRLVAGEQIATDVRAGVGRRELGSTFSLTVTAKPDADLAHIEAVVDEELANLVQGGPTPEELERVRTQQLAQFVRGLERIGGFAGKSDQLAEGEVYGDDPGFYKRRLARIESATADELQAESQRWLVDGGRFVLTVTPFPRHEVAQSGADRSKMPEVGDVPEAQFPAFTRAKLSNGLEVLCVERRAVPTVELSLLVDCGSAVEPAELSGLAGMTLNMMDEGTRTKTAVEITELQGRLGARLGLGADDDWVSLSLSALSANLPASLDLFADVLLNPAFPRADFERLQKEALVRLQSSKLEPGAMAARVLPPLVFGPEHPYGRLGGGSGTETTLAALTPQALAEFHGRWFKPNNARLIVAGDTSLAEIVPLLEQRLAAWKPGEVPAKTLGNARAIDRPVVYLLDRPQAAQSVIRVAIAAPPTGDPEDIAIEAMNQFLGGSFTSRINMNLREDKGWSYGSRSSIRDARGPRVFSVNAPVQTDKTKESMIEVARELAEITGSRPSAADELAQVQAQLTLSLAGSWETNGAVVGSLAEIVRYGLADDHWTTYAGKVRALDTAAVDAAAREIVTPANAVWIVVGDRAKIEASVREVGIGDVVVIDPDGKPVEAKP